jgi:psp operon transcriptional activator
LKNAIERSVYRKDDEDSQVNDIAFDPFDSPFEPRDRKPATSSAKSSPLKKVPPLFPVDFKARMREAERELLQAGLQRARFNQTVAAELLGLSYHQLRGKVKKHNLDVG